LTDAAADVADRSSVAYFGSNQAMKSCSCRRINNMAICARGASTALSVASTACTLARSQPRKAAVLGQRGAARRLRQRPDCYFVAAEISAASPGERTHNAITLD
jgi:hypothetical protein